MFKAKVLTRAAGLLVTPFLLPPLLQGQQTAPAKMRLSKIEFSGLERHTEQEAIANSGLQIGQVIDNSILDAAAQRLVDSGLFKKLSYRYTHSGGQAIVTFTVEETKGSLAPVTFDNFVWFSDDELLSAVRQLIPTFAGTISDSSVNGFTKKLQSLLEERKISGQVQYMPETNLSGTVTGHVFSVEGVEAPICSVHFSGAAAVPENDLIKKSKDLIGGDYRRTFVASFAQANLIPLYRERGHLLAKFSSPFARLESSTSTNCKGGVSVVLPVEEGLAYSWSNAQWDGNTNLSGPELDTALGIKAGELANGLRIDKGLESVRDAFEKKGYLAVRLGPTPAFEDASRPVTYKIEVKEGPQYRMGGLTLTGFSESTTNRLKSKWKLQSGEVYDASYLKDFLKREMVLDAREVGSPPKNLTTEIKEDREKLTVNVTISLK